MVWGRVARLGLGFRPSQAFWSSTHVPRIRTRPAAPSAGLAPDRPPACLRDPTRRFESIANPTKKREAAWPPFFGRGDRIRTYGLLVPNHKRAFSETQAGRGLESNRAGIVQKLVLSRPVSSCPVRSILVALRQPDGNRNRAPQACLRLIRTTLPSAAAYFSIVDIRTSRPASIR